MEIKTFKDLNDKELDKIINKHFNHWSKYSKEMTLEGVKDKFKNIYASSNKMPYGIALFENSKIIGFCTLKLNELKNYPEYNPWICSVMIFDEYRRQGKGRILIEYAKKEAKKQGFDQVYLWTDKAPEFYEKIGFTYVKDVLKNDETGYGKLYQISLKEDSYGK